MCVYEGCGAKIKVQLDSGSYVPYGEEHIESEEQAKNCLNIFELNELVKSMSKSQEYINMDPPTLYNRAKEKFVGVVLPNDHRKKQLASIRQNRCKMRKVETHDLDAAKDTQTSPIASKEPTPTKSATPEKRIDSAIESGGSSDGKSVNKTTSKGHTPTKSATPKKRIDSAMKRGESIDGRTAKASKKTSKDPTPMKSATLKKRIDAPMERGDLKSIDVKNVNASKKSPSARSSAKKRGKKASAIPMLARIQAKTKAAHQGNQSNTPKKGPAPPNPVTPKKRDEEAIERVGMNSSDGKSVNASNKTAWTRSAAKRCGKHASVINSVVESQTNIMTELQKQKKTMIPGRMMKCKKQLKFN